MKLSKTLGALWALVLSPMVSAQSQIFLLHSSNTAEINVEPIGELGHYSNQPQVTTKGVYFSFELGAGEGAQKDILFYDFASKAITNITNTPLHSEYSPTLIPNDDAISSVVVEPNGAQKLWRYSLDYNEPAQRLLDNGVTVGYHAWGASDDLIIFALGEPHTAQYFSTAQPEKLSFVAANPGRTFSYSAQLQGFTFIALEQNWLSLYNPKTKEVTKLFRLPNKVEDYTWVDADTIAYASQNRIYTKHIGNAQPASLWHDVSTYCDGRVTRLSYLFEGQKLAFVCEHND
ncbi:hypothetical protein AAEU32_06145 [Pseudoalteromonas sp. SSDWG2]|uniref:hypothetical protein n=1 Tax=Pseudoalteromonas sp. SSDWG2 TaxID=3139391 RepID=UPI003BAAB5D3